MDFGLVTHAPLWMFWLWGPLDWFFATIIAAELLVCAMAAIMVFGKKE